MPRATVLMTVYNAAPYLRECIDSVLHQTFKDFEFLIIDDGSNDGSREILDAQTDIRIKKHFNPKNIGIAPSLNQYFQNLETDYIFRMDADDICLPNRFEKQIAYMDSNPSLGMSGGALAYFGISNYTWFPAKTNDEISARIIFNCAIPNPTLVIRTSCIKKNNLNYDTTFPSPPMEDYALLIDSMGLFEFGNLDEVLVKHREHEGNQSRLFPGQKMESMIRIYEKLFNSIPLPTSPTMLKLHYQLCYNIPDLEEDGISAYLTWSKYLLKNFGSNPAFKKTLRFYLTKLLKYQKYRPVSALRLIYYLFRL